VFIELTEVQAVPLKDSVAAVIAVFTPPKHNADVLELPTPPGSRLAVFKLGVLVQFVPS